MEESQPPDVGHNDLIMPLRHGGYSGLFAVPVIPPSYLAPGTMILIEDSPPVAAETGLAAAFSEGC